MVSGSTVAAGVAVVFAGAAGAYYLYSQQLHLTVTESGANVDWSATGGTPGGGYSIALGGIYTTQGNFDSSGKASGVLAIPTGTPGGEYEVVIVDLTNDKFSGVYITVA